MKLDKIFKALSDDTRLRIINILQQCSGCCVCDLEKVLGESQPKISRHLAYLRRENLVKDDRCGSMIIYSLDSSAIVNQQVLNFLETVFPNYPKFDEDRLKFNQLLEDNEFSSLDDEGRCFCLEVDSEN